MQTYYNSVRAGKGAIFMAVCRGKVRVYRLIGGQEVHIGYLLIGGQVVGKKVFVGEKGGGGNPCVSQMLPNGVS